MAIKKSAARDADTNSVANKFKNSRGVKKVATVVVAAVVTLAVVVTAVSAGLYSLGIIGPNMDIKKNDYQAVFLTNGQVYFGKLENVQGSYATLTKVYYLQVDSTAQANGQAKTQADVTTQQAGDNNVQLIKLGNELHGPQDELKISTEQILFWENLKGNSKVSEAIKNYKAE